MHRTSAWARPHAAGERRTFWGVVPALAAPRPRDLSRRHGDQPPHPRDVPLPATFADWYAQASTYLGHAERLDLGLSRLAAGGALVVVHLVGALPGAAYLASRIGLPVEGPSSGTALTGTVVLAVGWTAWAWYRRRWTRAWDLRKAWSLAIHDEAVLALPVGGDVGEERDLDTDPESVHPYRAAGIFEVAERPFVDTVYARYGHTDRVRGQEALRGWTYSFLLLGLLVLVALSVRLQRAGGTLPLLVSLVLLPPVGGAWYRYVRRMRFAHRMAQTETRDRQRWVGLPLLPHVAADAADAARAPDEEPLAVKVRVLPPQPPVTGSTVLPPGRWTLSLSYDSRLVRLTPSDPSGSRHDLVVTGLISGAHPGLVGGRTRWHWLVLDDGTHVPVSCRQPLALAAAADFARIPVVSSNSLT
ncbi:hypothetical protein ACFQHV_17345 [Promicromonospora thailandica]|uniref:hypothetical protein n=1 Tax=Promicromonospora thailandica TaxID=765201 RepID=UPI0020A3BA5D|nr:hypothetical protein [Promicromonospora thailandica]